MTEEREVAGLRCFQVLEKLSSFLEGELPADQATQVRAHVGGCDVCEHFGGRFAEAVRKVREAAATEELESSIQARLRERLGLP